MEETQQQSNQTVNQGIQMQPQEQIPMSGSSGNMMKIMVVTIVILAVVGIVVYVVTSSASNKTYTPSSGSGYTSPTVVPTVAQTQEEQDVSRIEVGNVDSDIQSIDQDLSQL